MISILPNDSELSNTGIFRRSGLESRGVIFHLPKGMCTLWGSGAPRSLDGEFQNEEWSGAGFLGKALLCCLLSHIIF